MSPSLDKAAAASLKAIEENTRELKKLTHILVAVNTNLVELGRIMQEKETPDAGTE